MPTNDVESLIEAKQDSRLDQSKTNPHLAAPSLKELPKLQAEAIHLRFTDEASFDEIANRLSTSPENARQLVSRGLSRLRKMFKSRQEK